MKNALIALALLGFSCFGRSPLFSDSMRQEFRNEVATNYSRFILAEVPEIRVTKTAIFINGQEIMQVHELASLTRFQVREGYFALDSSLTAHALHEAGTKKRPRFFRDILFTIDDETPFNVLYKLLEICARQEFTGALFQGEPTFSLRLPTENRVVALGNESLELGIVANDVALTIFAKHGVLPSIYHDKQQMAWNSSDEVEDSLTTPIVAWFHKESGEFLTTKSYDLIREQPQKNDTCIAHLNAELNGFNTLKAGTPPLEQEVIIKKRRHYKEQQISSYDMARHYFVKIRNKYSNAYDRDSIKVSARDETPFHIIRSTINSCYLAGFKDILLTPLRIDEGREDAYGTDRIFEPVVLRFQRLEKKRDDDQKQESSKSTESTNEGAANNDTSSTNSVEGRPRESINRTIKLNLAALRFEFNKFLAEKPDLAGKITVKMAIDDYGTVLFCKVIQEETTTNYPPVEQAIINRIIKWKFGKIDKPGDVTLITYPFLFTN